MKKYQFKPFDKVLVRDCDKSTWKAGIYSHYEKTSAIPYICIGSYYSQCIPYNEETKHLIGTNKPYKEPEPKTYHVEWGSSQVEQQDYTDKEFENFIKTAVLHNKDISNFKVTRIC